MENKKGFVSTALVYSFLVIYLFLMVSIINMYLSKNTYMEALDDQVSQDIGITKATKSTLMQNILRDNVALETNLINFTTISNSTNNNGNGLYYVDETMLSGNDVKITDEANIGSGKKIYFFRGTVNNNYVVFGYKYDRGSDDKIVPGTVQQMCWRILRTTQDGSVRLIYNGLYEGTSCNESDVTIGSGAYNANNDDNAYVGYTFGKISATNYDDAHFTSQNDSFVKTKIDEFYFRNTSLYTYPEFDYQYVDVDGTTKAIPTHYSNVVNSVYCNDRVSNCMDAMTPSDDNSCGYGSEATKYGYSADKMNSYKCRNFEDKYLLAGNFAGNVYGGNDNETSLIYSIALPTASEVVMAGGAIGSENKTFFMKGNKSYWTMSASSFDGIAKVYIVSSDGVLVESDVKSEIGIRPVISIKEDMPVSYGSGLINEPYMLN